ncbi:MAG: CPBP family glutamic-type intramembrane protease [Planctomycetaceae bacterium]
MAPPATTTDYWSEARRPLACLLFLIPWIAVYEAGILVLADSEPDGLRNGADFWMRSVLSGFGLEQFFLLPLLVVAVLLTWHLVRRHPWHVRLETQLGMLAESLLLAVALIAVGQVHQLLFVNLHPGSSETDARLLTLATGSLNRAVSFIGAGVYEEVMFRLFLVPAAFFLFRMLECPPKFAAVMAAVTTACLFALAHHVGPAADAFNLFAFTFRIAAGTFFAAVFFLRGFGITVGCHAAYDLLVGVFLVIPGPR